MSSGGCRRVVVDPVNLVTWGGGLMPAVGSLDPRIRDKALYGYYLPKLAEDGHSDEVMNRCIAKAHGKRLPSGGSGVRRSASTGVLLGNVRNAQAAQASTSCTWMSHSHSIGHGRSEPQSITDLVHPGRRVSKTLTLGETKGGVGGLGYVAGPQRQWGPLARMLNERPG
eukprot:CAMPEP_0114697666 /NCGR_PEP_ID=MMETSP0191-20121206/74042_1 /TAXON_ID=126664 /ORGANISM="Sorites sp." /LENGTH=168 /DNA_ID=CAMNT_0001997049 /DNA_START=29 /DNA_END=535 /DNA_ORIENTATION=-